MTRREPASRRVAMPARVAPAGLSSAAVAEIAIVVHGGAGRMPGDPERLARMRAGAARAVDAGHAVLAAGAGALDAVEAAVVLLEDDPEYNAGRGAALTADGGVELDASVMDGA